MVSWVQIPFPLLWSLSSAGRAPALQAGGHRFEPYSDHQYARVAELADAQDLKSCELTPRTGSIPVSGILNEYYVGVAQLDRASDYGSEGRGFEPSRPRFI